MSDGAEISARLVVLREWLGLSQDEMAGRLGMPVRVYREWERPGRRQWRSLMQPPASRISAVTGVSLHWLCCGEYPDQPPSDVPLAIGGEPLPPVLRVVGSAVKRTARRKPSPARAAEIACFEMVRALPPLAQELLPPLMEAMADREPANVVRRLALDFMRAKGLSSAAARHQTNWFMRKLMDTWKHEGEAQ